MDTVGILLLLGVIVLLILVFPIAALVKAYNASSQVERLQREVDALKLAVRTQQPIEKPAKADIRKETLERVVTSSEATQEESPAVPVGPYVLHLPPVVQPPPPPPPPLEPQPESAHRPARSTQDWEILIGGNVFNRIGAVAILIGVALFLSYAFTHHWITPWMLFCLGIASGCVLLIGGAHFHKKGAVIFSQGLLGAGVSVLYLSVYAATNIYNLISNPMGMASMSTVTIVAILVALRYDSIAVSLLALVGGFFTPLLLGSNSPGGITGAVGLFLYITALDIGLLAVALRKQSWVVLEPLTLAGTYLVYLTWHSTTYTSGMVSVTAPFLSVFWALFFLLDLYRITRPADAYSDLRAGVSVASSLAFYLALYWDVNPAHHHLMAAITLGLAAIYFVTLLALMRKSENARSAVPRYAVTSMAFLAVATAIRFDGFILASLWSLEALALVCCAQRWRMRYVSACALGLQAASVLVLFTTDGVAGLAAPLRFVPVANLRFMAFAVLSASMGLSAILFRKMDSEADGAIADTLDYIWTILLAISFGLETSDYFAKVSLAHPKSPLVSGQYPEYLAMGAIWALYSLPLVWIGLRKNLSSILTCGYAALVIGAGTTAVTAASYAVMRNYTPFMNLRAAALALTAAILLVHRYFLVRYASNNRWSSTALGILDFCVVATGFELITLETVDYYRLASFRLSLSSLDAETELARDMFLAVAWSLYSLVVLLCGIWKKSQVLLVSALAVAATATITVTACGTSFEPIRSFTPVHNIRGLGFAVVMCALVIQRWLLQSRSDRHAWILPVLRILDFAAAVTGFQLIIFETIDYYRLAGYAHASELMPALHVANEFARDMSLATLWALYSVAVLLYGIRKRSGVLLACALSVAAAATIAIATRGLFFEPVKSFTPLCNIRVLAFAAVAAGLLVAKLCLTSRLSSYKWLRPVVWSIPIVISLLIFEALSIETWDFFGRSALPTLSMVQLHSLENMRQAALSVVWLIYSIILMGYGMSRRTRSLRFVAMGLFEVTILKVFLYDLSYLETLYRIFSFIGLGLVLMATSYLYHRFRNLILDVGSDTAREEP